MQLQKIKDVDGFEKDSTNSAVLSVDNRALYAYKEKRKNKLTMMNEINNLKKCHNEVSYDINSMKQELMEMKELLMNFISLQKGR
jgi:hypothetical protein|tara:strand:- start:123 stop:377 length:255 start_codon:yes stop_codon:yes gene_type:complete